MRIVSGLLLGFSALFVAGAVAAEPQEPAKTAAAFYAVYERDYHHDGIPTAKLRARFTPLITQTLNDVLAEAEAAEAAHFKATNNEEPPLYEGDVFTSLFEGATSHRVGNCVGEGNRAYCDVALGYSDGQGAGKTEWTDRVVLVKKPQGWLVDDIAYGSTWDFGNHGTLQATLKTLVADWKRAEALP